MTVETIWRFREYVEKDGTDWMEPALIEEEEHK
jgi:hypothetical protein